LAKLAVGDGRAVCRDGPLEKWFETTPDIKSGAFVSTTRQDEGIMRALIFKNGKTEFTPSYPDPIPGKNEVLVAVELAGICATDQEITRGYMNFSGVLGHEFVGRVIKGGQDIIGRRVVGEINCVCGKCAMCQSGLNNHCLDRQVIGLLNHDGVFADYAALPRRNVHVLPDVIPNEEAVFIEPLAAAFQIVKQVSLDERQKIIVVGDGKLGLLIVQVLTLRLPKGKIVLLGKHPEKLAFCEKRGIQSYLLDDMLVKPEWDLVVDCTGSADGFTTACNLVRPRGKLILKTTRLHDKPIDMSPLVVNEITLIGSRCGPFPDAINALAAKQIITNGLITSTFALEDGVKAMAKADQPDQIKVVLTVKK
jgi:threonine dehydrogenase-like Zn-dependent dehydrogenase